MPASSKAQQRFFGVVKSMQKGDKPKKGEAGKIAKQMSKKDVDKYASTKHKGKPEKVKREQRVKNLIKKIVREELAEVTQNMQMRKNFPGFNANEYAVIDNWIDMNSLSKTIAMFKKHKKSFSQFVKDAAKARMFETTKRDYKAEYKKFQSSTNYEIADELDMPLSSVTARCRELQVLNLVEDSGTRRKTKYGKQAIVWQRKK